MMYTKRLSILAIAVCFALSGCGARNQLREMDIDEVDLSVTENGTYLGEYGRSRWLYQVEVKVDGNRITDIEILKGDANGGLGSVKLNERLIQAAVENQNITFDAVSGASVNTKVFQKALEKALAPAAGAGRQ